MTLSPVALQVEGRQPVAFRSPSPIPPVVCQFESRVVGQFESGVGSLRAYGLLAALLQHFLRDEPPSRNYQARYDYGIVQVANDGDEIWNQIKGHERVPYGQPKQPFGELGVRGSRRAH